MAEDKEYHRILILSRDNYELWFQDMRFKLQGKEIFYVIETSKREYAWIHRAQGSTPVVKTPATSNTGDTDVDYISTKFEALGGTWNEEKAKEYARDQAKAFYFISTSLGVDDKSAIGEYKEAKEFWTYLKLKYGKTNQTTAHKYMTKLQTFEFDQEKGIDSAWSTLKGYRRKGIAADATLRVSYPDEALFLILTRALPSEYKPITRGFITQPSLTVEEKLRMLGEQEDEIRDEAVEHAKVARANKSSRPHHRHADSNASGSDDSQYSIKCLLCKGAHRVLNCRHLDLAGKLLRKHLREEKRTKKTGSRFPPPGGENQKRVATSTRTAAKSSTRKLTKQNGLIADANDTEDSDSETCSSSSLNSNSNDDEGTAIEHAQISKESISKAPPSSWASDSAASSHMSDQPSIFRHMTQIKRRLIKVGGG